MKRFSAKLSETVLLDLRAQTKTLNLGVYAQWAPNDSREVLFAEFETKFFFNSVQNSKTGDGMALDKQV